MNGTGEGHEHDPIQVPHYDDTVDEKREDGMPLTESPVDMTVNEAKEGNGKVEEGQNGHGEDDDEDASDVDKRSSDGEEQGEDGEVEAEDEDEEDGEDVDEDADDDDEEDEEEEEDEEPALKYERLGGDFPKLFEKDSASTLFVSNKTLVTRLPILLPHQIAD